MNLKSIVPISAKRLWKHSQRWFVDLFQGNHKQFARKTKLEVLPIRFSIQQAIKKSHLYENKRANLQLAAKRVESIRIMPDEIFSFWKTVRAPTAGKGYKKGRNIINGVLTEDYGGGLCQISGLLYHLALSAGLSILERHPHSIDIYTEENRYTPLGADATVVYAYKDLRFKNTLDTAIHFSFEITAKQFKGHFHTNTKVEAKTIVFKREEQENYRIITTFIEGKEWVKASKYRIK